MLHHVLVLSLIIHDYRRRLLRVKNKALSLSHVDQTLERMRFLTLLVFNVCGASVTLRLIRTFTLVDNMSFIIFFLVLVKRGRVSVGTELLIDLLKVLWARTESLHQGSVLLIDKP